MFPDIFSCLNSAVEKGLTAATDFRVSSMVDEAWLLGVWGYSPSRIGGAGSSSGWNQSRYRLQGPSPVACFHWSHNLPNSTTSRDSSTWVYGGISFILSQAPRSDDIRVAWACNTLICRLYSWMIQGQDAQSNGCLQTSAQSGNSPPASYPRKQESKQLLMRYEGAGARLKGALWPNLVTVGHQK